MPYSRLHKIKWCTHWCSLASWAGHVTLSTSRDSSVVPRSLAAQLLWSALSVRTRWSRGNTLVRLSAWGSQLNRASVRSCSHQSPGTSWRPVSQALRRTPFCVVAARKCHVTPYRPGWMFLTDRTCELCYRENPPCLTNSFLNAAIGLLCLWAGTLCTTSWVPKYFNIGSVKRHQNIQHENLMHSEII